MTARVVDANGFLNVKGCPISSYGIFDYSAGQVGLEGDPNRIVKVYRPESAVSDPAAIESFRNLPFINEHTMLSGYAGDDESVAPEDKGVDGVLTSNVYYEAPWLRGDMKIFSRQLQDEMTKGKKDLSLGYGCKFTIQDGDFNGQPYEVIQTDLRGNHIALVKEGRVGGARVLDGLCFDHLSFEAVKPSKEVNNMPKIINRKVGDNAVEQLKALIPALQQFLNEEGTEPAHQGDAVPAEGEASTSGASLGEGQEPAAAVATAAPEAQAVPSEGDAGGQGEGAAQAAEVAGTEGASEGEPAEGASTGGMSLNETISALEALLAELRGNAEGAQAADEDLNGEQSTAAAEDTVTGLQETQPTSGAQVGAEPSNTDNGSASSGPKAGANTMAQDSALRNFYSDLAVKDSTVKRLSKVVGAFDSSAMDSAAVVAYGVKKLGIDCAKGTEKVALDAYLNGVEKAAVATRQSVVNQAQDSATTTRELDAYLKGDN